MSALREGGACSETSFGMIGEATMENDPQREQVRQVVSHED